MPKSEPFFIIKSPKVLNVAAPQKDIKIMINLRFISDIRIPHTIQITIVIMTQTVLFIPNDKANSEEKSTRENKKPA